MSLYQVWESGSYDDPDRLIATYRKKKLAKKHAKLLGWDHWWEKVDISEKLPDHKVWYESTGYYAHESVLPKPKVSLVKPPSREHPERVEYVMPVYQDVVMAYADYISQFQMAIQGAYQEAFTGEKKVISTRPHYASRRLRWEDDPDWDKSWDPYRDPWLKEEKIGHLYWSVKGFGLTEEEAIARAQSIWDYVQWRTEKGLLSEEHYRSE